MSSFAQIKGRMFRFTKIDACGNRVLGPNSVVTTKGLITLGLTSNTDAGTTINVQNADGDNCINEVPTPKFTNFTGQFSLCNTDPALVNLLSQAGVVYNEGSDATGFRVNSRTDVDAFGFAVEVWTRVPASACVAGQVAYGYSLFPFFKGGVMGDFTYANDAVNFTISGANSQDGNNWGSGVNLIRANSTTGVAGLLQNPLDPNDHMHLERVSVAPPAAVDGFTQLGVPATTATQVAGAAATLTPTNSYPPDTLAQAQSGPRQITASPTTAWSTGSYLLLSDRVTKISWNGTAWAAGARP